MKLALVALVVVHGLIHFLGFAKAVGLAELPQLTQPVSRGLGVVWLLAGSAMLGAAFHLLWAPRSWWITALVAVILSQVVIVTSWSDARFGTVANVLILAAVVYGFARDGPLGFRAEYEEDVAARLSAPPHRDVLTEADLAGLPEPVRRYVARSGAVGRPRPWHFRAKWAGRIRQSPDDPWMRLAAEQHNFLDEPARFFHLDARRGGLPVDGYHAFSDGRATMRIRLLSLVSMVHARGPEMDRAETVTFFNDLTLLAPGALADARIEWRAVDDRTARGRYTLAGNTVSAVLHFDEGGDLVDFVSDDRSAASPGEELKRQRWSTPVLRHGVFDGLRAVAAGEGRWHPPDAPAYAYIELELLELDVD